MDSGHLGDALLFAENDSGKEFHDLCRETVAKDGKTLEYVPRALRDYEMCLIAIKNHGDAYAFVPEHLKNALYSEAVDNDCCAFHLVPEEQRTYEMYYKFIELDGSNLKFVPDKFLDYEMYLAAVKSKWSIIAQVPESMRDYQLCITAIQANSSATSFVPRKFSSLRPYAKFESIAQEYSSI